MDLFWQHSHSIANAACDWFAGTSLSVCLPSVDPPDERNTVFLRKGSPMSLFSMALLMTSFAWIEETPAQPAVEIAAPTADEQAVIAKIRESGGQVLQLAQNDQRLEVTFHLASSKVTDETIAPLKQIARLVDTVNLRGTEITDAAGKVLAELPELRRLHLEKTRITDAALADLTGLKKLEYLNVYGTAIGDAGLKHLSGISSLKSLYVWQTSVTDAGCDALKAAVNGLKIVRGV